jgi:hypothetical protein
MLHVEWKLTVFIPQLETLGDQLMAGLQEIRDAVVAQGEAIAAELDQLAQQQVIDPAEVTALAEMVRANTAQIEGMVDAEPPPMPEPEP